MNESNYIGCLVDTETTGLSPDKDEIIEIAMLLFSLNKETGEVEKVIEHHSYLREPLTDTARANYNEAYRVHGIPYHDVKGKRFDDQIITEVFSKADILIAHNASFDRSFIYQMYPEINEKQWYCSMRNIKWKEYGFPNKRQLTLLQGHKIATSQSHRALDDILQLMELLKRNNPNKQTYLQELLQTKAMRKYKPKKKYDLFNQGPSSNASYF